MPVATATICRLCGTDTFEAVYTGPIRMGRFGNVSPEAHTLHRCTECRAVALPESLVPDAAFYESDEYRASVDIGTEAADFYRSHDAEQLRHLGMVGGTGDLRGKTIADIGCGAGAFLDFVSGVAGRCIAIEPSQTFQQTLGAKGYTVYPYAAEAHAAESGQIDFAVSFSVLEHVADPLGLLRDVRQLLAPGGRLVLSTPNADDILMTALPDVYPAFFYREAHLWYFDAVSLERLLAQAGFTDVDVAFFHRFNLSNFRNWQTHHRPCGEDRLPDVTPAMDAAWKAELEATGRADYLVATARI